MIFAHECIRTTLGRRWHWKCHRKVLMNDNRKGPRRWRKAGDMEHARIKGRARVRQMQDRHGSDALRLRFRP